MRVVVAVMTCLAIGMLCCPSPASRAFSMLPEGVEVALSSEGPAHVTEAWVDRSLGSGWLLVREPRVAYSKKTVLPVFLGSSASSVPPGSTLRLDGIVYRVGDRVGLLPSNVAVYVDPESQRSVAPFPDAAMAAAWTSFQEIDLQTTRVATVDPPMPPPIEEGGPGVPVQRTAEEGTVADAKLTGGENITLTDKLVIAAYDPDVSVSSQFFYIIDRNQLYSIGGIKVVPQSPVVVKPGDRVTVVGNVVPSGTNVAECYIDATSVTVGTEEDVPPSPGMTNRSTAGGAFGLQQALYAGMQQVGSGLSAVGSLVRVWGRIDKVAIEDDHVTYWLSDGSNLERTGHTGLRVVAWADSATPSPYLADYVSFVGVVGAEMCDGVPVPVVRVSRKQVRDIFYVDGTGGQDSNNGSSWALAKRSVQAAIDAASEDDEVWVKAGTYYKAANDDNVALLKGGVSLYGGFAGTEANRWERDTASNPTILDGRYPNELPGIVVIRLDGQTVTSRIDSLTVQYGYNAGFHGGGGMQCEESPAVVCNNVFRWNLARCGLGGAMSCDYSACFIMFNNISDNRDSSSVQGGGGGICATGYPSVYIAGNSVTNNEADTGAGVYVSQSEPLLRGNIISGNDAHWDGGGVYVNQGGGIIRGNTISSNQTEQGSGGAIYAYQGATPLRVIENTMEGNTALDAGGALCFYQTGLELLGNAISGNVCSSFGGAVMCYDAPVTIQGNTFSENECETESGGALCLNDASGIVTQNEFSGNDSGSDGGAISCGASNNLEITRNTFTGNDGGDRGGALSITDSTGVEVINNLFVGNHVEGTGGGAVFAFADWNKTTRVALANNTFATNQANDIQGNGGDGGAVLARCYDEWSILELVSVNNVMYCNRARNWQSTSSTGNSVWLDPYASSCVLSYCGAYSEVCGLESYHYWTAVPDSGCITNQILSGDAAIFETGYRLSLSGPPYSPLDRGHDHDIWPYDTVPTGDMDDVGRPQGSSTDMGAYEALQ